MLIQIIGAGAVGMLMASFMAEAGLPIHIVTRRVQQAELLLKHGLTRQNIDGTIQRFPVQASTQLKNEQSVVIVAVKYDQLAGVLETLHSANLQIPILFVQNGLAHFEQGLQLPQQHIAYSSVQFGAQKQDDTTVLHRGVGPVKIAVARGQVETFEVIHQLNDQAFPIVQQLDAEHMLTEKALLNCFINPLTAILQVKNGELLTNKYAFQILQTLYNELMGVFPSMLGTFEDVCRLCERTAMNTSSMLTDRLKGKKTEVDTIVGAVIEKARKNGHTLPTLTLLYRLVKAFEESGEKM